MQNAATTLTWTHNNNCIFTRVNSPTWWKSHKNNKVYRFLLVPHWSIILVIKKALLFKRAHIRWNHISHKPRCGMGLEGQNCECWISSSAQKESRTPNIFSWKCKFLLLVQKRQVAKNLLPIVGHIWLVLQRQASINSWQCSCTATQYLKEREK